MGFIHNYVTKKKWRRYFYYSWGTLALAPMEVVNKFSSSAVQEEDGAQYKNQVSD